MQHGTLTNRTLLCHAVWRYQSPSAAPGRPNHHFRCHDCFPSFNQLQKSCSKLHAKSSELEATCDDSTRSTLTTSSAAVTLPMMRSANVPSGTVTIPVCQELPVSPVRSKILVQVPPSRRDCRDIELEPSSWYRRSKPLREVGRKRGLSSVNV